ncbi:MAG: type III-A CRISPR-associated protein Cas10/Csm1 [SAR324 cluster bacterium]|nr:type III-A CRISPR-associated protein Cas10/Csm1 [SAR324 cluster bacterium]
MPEPLAFHQGLSKYAFKSYRMDWLLERIRLQDKVIQSEYKVTLNPLDTSRATLFPKKWKNEDNQQPLLKSSHGDGYQPLWFGDTNETGFVTEMEYLVEKVNYSREKLLEHISTIQQLMKKYCWSIPSSVFDLMDISLYNHSHATAAIAGCLYAYAEKNKQWEYYQTIAEKDESRKALQQQYRSHQQFLLICGDVSGIQKFIYDIGAKGAAKQLKGRSFYIQIICELIANYLLDLMELESVNLLYSSGGKFYILAPNVFGDRFFNQRDYEINDFLLTEFNGSLFFRLERESLSPNDLTAENNLPQIWERLARKVSLKDRQKFSSVILRQGSSFFYDPTSSAENLVTCSATFREFDWTKEIWYKEVENEWKKQHLTKPLSGDQPICEVAYKQINLGKKLKSAVALLIRDKNEQSGKDHSISVTFGDWKKEVVLLTQHDLNHPDYEGKKLIVLSPEYWNLFQSGGVIPQQWSVYGGNHFPVNPAKPDEPLTYDQLAGKSAGMNRLGVLRMDVDNLGKLFREGLMHYPLNENKARKLFGTDFKKQPYCLSRIIQFSNLLDLFFSGYLPQLLQLPLPDLIHDLRNGNHETYGDNVQIVYSGGDDVFIVGSWDVLPFFAYEIYQSFQEYTGHNPDFSLSAGISIHGGKYPIYKAAEFAGNAESAAKQSRRSEQNGKHLKTEEMPDSGVLTKNSLTFLGKTMTWETFGSLVKPRMEELVRIESNEKRSALSKRLLQIYQLWENSQQLREQKADLGHQIEADKWTWRGVYSLHRLGESHNQVESFSKTIESWKSLIMSLRKDGQEYQSVELMGMIVRWSQYITRTKTDRNDLTTI